MTTELKRQKLHEYVEAATEEEIKAMYENYLDETGPTDWSDEFIAEIEQRREDYLSGKDKGVSLEEAMEHAKKAIQTVRQNAAISY